MAGSELSARWRWRGAGALVLLGGWACLNPETDDFPTYAGAGGSGATAVDRNTGGSSALDGEGAGGGAGNASPGAAGSSPTGSAGAAGTMSQPPAMSGQSDAGVSDAGPVDGGGPESDGG